MQFWFLTTQKLVGISGMNSVFNCLPLIYMLLIFKFYHGVIYYFVCYNALMIYDINCYYKMCSL